MAPPCATFPASELPTEIQTTYDKSAVTYPRRRKDKIDLGACELSEMVQYECGVKAEGGAGAVRGNARVVCWPVVRLFRRCQDRKGSFTVETTVWEGLSGAEK